MNFFDVKDKNILITGSSRGIGKAIAKLFLELGANVTITGELQSEVDNTQEEFKNLAGRVSAVTADLSSAGQVTDLFLKSRTLMGPLQVLICNAGMNGAYGATSSVTKENFDQVMQVNFLSAYQLCKLVYPDFLQLGGGSIIFTSSVTGVRGSSVLGAYGVTKSSLIQLARNLAVEWGSDNIRVNCIAPGLIKTDFSKVFFKDEEKTKALVSRTTLKRAGDPEEVAGAALMLASRAGEYITGQTIFIDGGYTVT